MYIYNGAGLDADLLTTTGAYVVSNNMDNLPYIDGYFKGAWGTLAHGYWIRFRTGSAWHPWYKITGAEV